MHLFHLYSPSEESGMGKSLHIISVIGHTSLHFSTMQLESILLEATEGLACVRHMSS